MEKLQLDEFLKYNFLSNTNVTEDGKVVFVKSISRKDRKGYVNDLYMYDGAVKQLTQSGSVSNYIIWDNNKVLFQAGSENAMVVFKWLDLNTGVISEAFTLPLFTASVKKLSDKKVAIVSTISKNDPDLYKNEKRVEVLKEMEEEKDYEILDENPYWFNGAGFINSNRSAIFTMDVDDPKSLKRVTEPLENVSNLVVKGTKIFYLSNVFTVLREHDGKIRSYDFVSEEFKDYATPAEIHMEGLHSFKDGLICFGSTQIPWGINQNHTFYFLNPETEELSVFYDNQESTDSSVGSDCRYGHGKSCADVGDTLYYVSTRFNTSHLFEMSKPNEEVQLFDSLGSVDDFCVLGNKIFFVGLRDGKLQELYSFDKDTKEVKQLTSLNEEVLKGKYVAKYNEVTTVSHDTTIYGWVLLPEDFDPNKKYPAILDIHGGPKTVYGPVFYHEMQYWVNKGYIVMYCNPIGGDGRGNEFMYMRGRFGTDDYDSLMAFVDKVLEVYPQIDDKKVCVTGGSYGGFMTNWIIGHTNRFVAAASQRSISNWISFAGTSDIGYMFDKDQCKVEDVIEEGHYLWDRSPLRFANNCTTPTLFIHSDEDYRCPMEQALQLMSALMQKGVETRMCYFHGENHELSRGGMPKHRVKRITEITNWFDKHIG